MADPVAPAKLTVYECEACLRDGVDRLDASDLNPFTCSMHGPATPDEVVPLSRLCDEGAVEAVARAEWDADQEFTVKSAAEQGAGVTPEPWESAPTRDRDHYRTVAREGLAALRVHLSGGGD